MRHCAFYKLVCITAVMRVFRMGVSQSITTDDFDTENYIENAFDGKTHPQKTATLP
jgi:hypothetical protein